MKRKDARWLRFRSAQPPQAETRTADLRRQSRLEEPPVAEPPAIPRLIVDLTHNLVALDIAKRHWRCAADDAAQAFRAWDSEATSRRPAGAVAFLAALEREERAADEYRRAWEAWCSSLSGS